MARVLKYLLIVAVVTFLVLVGLTFVVSVSADPNDYRVYAGADAGGDTVVVIVPKSSKRCLATCAEYKIDSGVLRIRVYRHVTMGRQGKTPYHFGVPVAVRDVPRVVLEDSAGRRVGPVVPTDAVLAGLRGHRIEARRASQW